MKIQVTLTLEIPDVDSTLTLRLQGAAYAGALRAISSILQDKGVLRLPQEKGDSLWHEVEKTPVKKMAKEEGRFSCQ